MYVLKVRNRFSYYNCETIGLFHLADRIMVSSHGQAHGFSPNYVITDVYTCPISIETYVEFKKLDMSDLVVHGNNELTDLEKTNLKRLKNGIRKMLKSINQN